MGWSSVLSLGEQQRMNFARAFVQPSLQLALIDEGTSACDSASEARLYTLLSRRLRSHVSVGHRPSLRSYHSHALWLRRGCMSSAGTWGPAHCSVLPMAEFKAACMEDD